MAAHYKTCFNKKEGSIIILFLVVITLESNFFHFLFVCYINPISVSSHCWCNTLAGDCLNPIVGDNIKNKFAEFVKYLLIHPIS